MARSWQKSEITYLKRYGANKTPSELARRFETDVPEVTAQLKELGIDPKGEGGTVYDDPVLDTYEKALKALHRGKWKKAAEQLGKVVEDVDQPIIASRARQYLRVCQSHLEETGTDDGDDPFLEAVVLKNRGELDKAMKVATSGPKDDDRFAYLVASIHSLQKQADQAEKALLRAVELNPKNRVYAFHDPDFSLLREDEEYSHLFSES